MPVVQKILIPLITTQLDVLTQRIGLQSDILIQGIALQLYVLIPRITIGTRTTSFSPCHGRYEDTRSETIYFSILSVPFFGRHHLMGAI